MAQAIRGKATLIANDVQSDQRLLLAKLHIKAGVRSIAILPLIVVRQVLAGYAGGPKGLAQYELVSTGTTGHAESVKVVFDPHQISYGEILRIYFSVATDPTQLNEQFPDEGPQYRGDIFYLDAGQQAVAERYIAQLQSAHVYRRPIVTRLDAYKGFFPAESYHQDYLLRHPDAPYIATYDLPKVAALKSLFPSDYRANPLRSL